MTQLGVAFSFMGDTLWERQVQIRGQQENGSGPMLADPILSRDHCEVAKGARRLAAQWAYSRVGTWAQRILPTLLSGIALLQQAWASCRRNESLHERDDLLGISQQRENEIPVQTGLEALDDQTVDRLYHEQSAPLRQDGKTRARDLGVNSFIDMGAVSVSERSV